MIVTARARRGACVIVAPPSGTLQLWLYRSRMGGRCVWNQSIEGKSRAWLLRYVADDFRAMLATWPRKPETQEAVYVMRAASGQWLWDVTFRRDGAGWVRVESKPFSGGGHA